MKPPKIKFKKEYQTKRLILRTLTLSDYQKWKDSQLDRRPKQNPHDTGPRPKSTVTLARYKKTLAKYKLYAKQDYAYIFGAFRKSDQKLIGNFLFNMIIRDFDKANLGYNVFNKFWKQGYGKEIAKKALSIGHKEMHFHRLEAIILKDNHASIALAKSIGMKKEGIRKKYIKIGRSWKDAVVYTSIK